MKVYWDVIRCYLKDLYFNLKLGVILVVCGGCLIVMCVYYKV